MNVLVIPEDFTKDQYLLKPIVEKMLVGLGVPAKVRVCQNPRLGGVSQALREDRLREILSMYKGMIGLFLLVVDRDGVEPRRAVLDDREEMAASELPDGVVLLAENAWQEIEVWALAGVRDLPKEWSWKQVRSELNPKEVYFTPYAKMRGLANAPHEGRARIGREAAANYDRIRQLCPEDVANLEKRIAHAVGSQAT